MEVFQSPKSGKFESNQFFVKERSNNCARSSFNPLDRGNLNQILDILKSTLCIKRFNPLDRGNLNQMPTKRAEMNTGGSRFNPLDRGNLNQIWCWEYVLVVLLKSFNPLDRGI